MNGTRARSNVSAAATLARIINSSISRCASSRGGVKIRPIVPSGLSKFPFGQVEVKRGALCACLLRAP